MMTWEYFKQAAMEEFSEINETWRVQEKWYLLYQIGSIRSYICIYCTLILSLKDLSEIDRLIKSVYGLKPHIKSEVEKQEPTTLTQAYWMENRF
jgi:hypothetical protein